MAWTFVFDEFSSFPTAAWVEWLTVNGLFCWLPEEVLTWLDALDLSRLADGSGGVARLATLRNIRAAHAELPWGTVVANVRRRDYRSKVARQVVDGKTEFEAIATLIRKVSDLTLADTMRDTFVSELQDAPELAS
eukprot:contig_26917_g6615